MFKRKNQNKTNRPKMGKTEKISLIIVIVLLTGSVLYPLGKQFLEVYQEVSDTYDYQKEIEARLDYDNDPPAKDDGINATQADLSQYTYLEDKNPALYEITLGELERIFEDGDEAVIYLSKVDCWYCQAAIIAADDIGRYYQKPIYYLQLPDDISGSDYETLKTLVDDALPTDSDGEKTFTIPVFFAVKDGKITDSHIGTVDGFVPGNQDGVLTQEQYEELMEEYSDVIKSLGNEKTGLVELGTGKVITLPDFDALESLELDQTEGCDAETGSSCE